MEEDRPRIVCTHVLGWHVISFHILVTESASYLLQKKSIISFLLCPGSNNVGWTTLHCTSHRLYSDDSPLNETSSFSASLGTSYVSSCIPQNWAHLHSALWLQDQVHYHLCWQDVLGKAQHCVLGSADSTSGINKWCWQYTWLHVLPQWPSCNHRLAQQGIFVMNLWKLLGWP